MDKILVTGSNGFIGHNLVKKLNSMHVSVTCIDNLSTGKVGVIPNYSIIADVAKDNLSVVLSKYGIDYPDYIYHFASPCSVIQFNRNPVKRVHDTIYGFKNILDLAKNTGASVIFPSSGSVYGSLPSPQKESDIPQTQNLYGATKLAIEYMADVSDVKTIGLRIFAGYGPGESHKGDIASVIYTFARDMMEGKSPVIWGNGEQSRDFIYIEDIVKCLIKSTKLASYRHPIVNVGSGISTSFNKITDIINDNLDVPIEPKYIECPTKSYIQKTQADTSRMDITFGVRQTKIEYGIQWVMNGITYEKTKGSDSKSIQ